MKSEELKQFELLNRQVKKLTEAMRALAVCSRTFYSNMEKLLAQTERASLASCDSVIDGADE